MEIKYFFSKNKDNTFHNNIKINDYYFNYNFSNDKIDYIEKNNYYFIIIGNFVDSRDATKDKDDIIKEVIKSDSIKELVKQTEYLAGRYLVFMGKNKKLEYVLTDSVSSIPVNYHYSANEFAISSHQKLIADSIGFEISEDAKAIKKGAEEQQPLPNDITMYKEIRALIPNHYLDIHSRESIRFFPVEEIEFVEMDYAITETIDKSKNIIKAFLQKEKLSIPITSGVDSRTVLALFKDYIDVVPLYTYYSDNFNDDSGDIKVPKLMAETLNLDYLTMDKASLSKEQYNQFSKELAGQQNENILRNGLTYSQSDISKYRPIPGDLISISKSPFGKNLPESLATLNYFITKTHNYSSEVKKHVENWMDVTRPYTEKTDYSLYDLFNWEYRLGRWMPNNVQNYDYFMQQVYIFNCRYLMKLWVSITREERTERSLHLEIIKKEWPELLEFPINPDDKKIDQLFDNSYMFYIGSFMKYHLKRFV